MRAYNNGDGTVSYSSRPIPSSGSGWASYAGADVLDAASTALTVVTAGSGGLTSRALPQGAGMLLEQGAGKVAQNEAVQVSKKAMLLRTGPNDTHVDVKTKVQADALLNEAFPGYQKTAGVGATQASGKRIHNLQEATNRKGTYHKDYYIDPKTGRVRGHENSPHGNHPHINIKRTDGKKVLINVTNAKRKSI